MKMKPHEPGETVRGSGIREALELGGGSGEHKAGTHHMLQ